LPPTFNSGFGEVSPTPSARRLAHDTPELLRKVRLVGEAAGKRDLTEWFVGRQHRLLRQFQPQPDEIGVRRIAECLLEGPAEVTHAERDLLRQFIHLHGILQVLSQVPVDLTPLPWRQAAAGARLFSLVRLGKKRRQSPRRPARAIEEISLDRAADLVEDRNRRGEIITVAAFRAES